MFIILRLGGQGSSNLESPEYVLAGHENNMQHNQQSQIKNIMLLTLT